MVPTKIEMVNVTQQFPFQGWFATHGLALATMNLSTKFEVYVSTHYRDIKGNTKY